MTGRITGSRSLLQMLRERSGEGSVATGEDVELRAKVSQ